MARTEKRFTGDVGEELASRFLAGHGYEIVERNYLKKWGEIDVIAKKGGILHFVEVKTVKSRDVSGETDGYRPEENVHPKKLERLSRAIETYLADKKVSPETNWQIDVITVLLDIDSKKARIGVIGNVIA